MPTNLLRELNPTTFTRAVERATERNDLLTLSRLAQAARRSADSESNQALGEKATKAFFERLDPVLAKPGGAGWSETFTPQTALAETKRLGRAFQGVEEMTRLGVPNSRPYPSTYAIDTAEGKARSALAPLEARLEQVYKELKRTHGGQEQQALLDRLATLQARFDQTYKEASTPVREAREQHALALRVEEQRDGQNARDWASLGFAARRLYDGVRHGQNYAQAHGGSTWKETAGFTPKELFGKLKGRMESLLNAEKVPY
jgi:hypothetical protein